MYISRKPAGRHLTGGEAGETAQKSRHSSVNWVGAGVLWLGEVPGGNSVTVSYRFPPGPPLGEGYATYILKKMTNSASMKWKR